MGTDTDHGQVGRSARVAVGKVRMLGGGQEQGSWPGATPGDSALSRYIDRHRLKDIKQMVNLKKKSEYRLTLPLPVHASQ